MWKWRIKIKMCPRAALRKAHNFYWGKDLKRLTWKEEINHVTISFVFKTLSSSIILVNSRLHLKNFSFVET